MSRSGGPSIVAFVFKAFAVLVVVAGVVTAFKVDELRSSASLAIAIGVLAGTAVAAASLAFFGYVLDLLVDIRDATVPPGEWDDALEVAPE